MSSGTPSLILVESTASRAETLDTQHPEDPIVGKWYWLRLKNWSEEDTELACITHVGSNFFMLKTVSDSSYRIHGDDFFNVCRHEPNPDSVIDQNVARCNTQVHALMEEIKSVTARLGVGDNLSLPGQEGPTETRALATIGSAIPIKNYKKSLIKAKDKTLPELFGKVKNVHEALKMWMTAKLIPMKAQSGSLKETIEKIESRIFSVELYAGLSEQIEHVKDGDPAALSEPIHLMQRRAYMDEECLAQYETGGMDFKSLKQFDKWLTRPSNLNRLMPFQRCVLAFQVRRDRKDRPYDEDEYGNIFSYISFVMQMDAADKLTFLYIRNGDQLFRLSTKFEFGEKLFPDMTRQLLNAGRKLWAKDEHTHWDILTEDEYLEIKKKEENQIAVDQRKYDEWKARIDKMTAAEKKEESHFGPHVHTWWDRDKYHPYNQDSVYYDDITKAIRSEMERHNRLVLILQGLLDRSPVLHPHPPWSLWDSDSFVQALVLHYDNDRALTTGDPPDFEVYRNGLNASIVPGSITVGQQRVWLAVEKAKDDDAGRHRRNRASRGGGPGTLAYVVEVSSRSKTVLYQWTRKRQRWGLDDDNNPHEIGCKFKTEIRRVLNVSAYRPGDFKLFFSDPRTRADYVKWAPLLLEAEEYHAGNREIAPVKPLPARVTTKEGRRKYEQRKRNLELVGKAVRLRRDVDTKGKKHYPTGTLFRVTGLHRGEFTIERIEDDGQFLPGRDDWETRMVITNMQYSSLIVDTTIPPSKNGVDDE